MSEGVRLVRDIPSAALRSLLDRYDLELSLLGDGQPITASFWGDSEAGIIGRQVYVRGDTPIHSLLHETSHIICMTDERREKLDRDAGGNDLEESAVCYLQIVLADEIAGIGRARLMRDMDAWGYSFRLGSTSRWFADDADDARAWLLQHHLLTGERSADIQAAILSLSLLAVSAIARRFSYRSGITAVYSSAWPGFDTFCM